MGGAVSGGPLPKQGFADSNPVTHSRNQEQGRSASDVRPVGLRVTFRQGKIACAQIHSLSHFACSELRTSHDAPPRSANHARKSLYSGTAQTPFCALAPEAKLITRRQEPDVRHRRRHRNQARSRARARAQMAQASLWPPLVRWVHGGSPKLGRRLELRFPLLSHTSGLPHVQPQVFLSS